MQDEPTLQMLFEAKADAVAGLLEHVIDEEHAVQHAPGWIELLIWNVLVAFVVGVSSNAAFALLAQALKRKLAGGRRGSVHTPRLIGLHLYLNPSVLPVRFNERDLDSNRDILQS